MTSNTVKWTNIHFFLIIIAAFTYCSELKPLPMLTQTDLYPRDDICTHWVFRKCETLPQKAVVANRLLSRGGAHLAQIPWQAGYDTPWRTLHSRYKKQKPVHVGDFCSHTCTQTCTVPQQGPGISWPGWHSCNGSEQQMESACWGWMWPRWQSQTLFNTKNKEQDGESWSWFNKSGVAWCVKIW